MADSCCSPSPNTLAASTSRVPTRPKAVCPTNQKVGQAIDALTLKSLLALPLTQVTHAEYRFCPDPHCPTVYYSADGEQLFTEDALREKVYQKHPDADEHWVCYCFQHTLASIRNEIMATGSSTVIEQITAGIQAGQCACDIRNPQGDCCLGNVRQIVNRLQVELTSKMD